MGRSIQVVGMGGSTVFILKLMMKGSPNREHVSGCQYNNVKAISTKKASDSVDEVDSTVGHIRFGLAFKSHQV